MASGTWSQPDQPLLGVATRADFGNADDDGVVNDGQPELFGRRISMPFTVVFQTFMVIALTAIAVTVLVLFRSVTVVVIGEVRKHYLHVAADEIDSLTSRRLDGFMDAAAFAAATSRVHALSVSGSQLLRHAVSTVRLYPRLAIGDVAIVESSQGAAACTANHSNALGANTASSGAMVIPVACARASAFHAANDSWDWQSAAGTPSAGRNVSGLGDTAFAALDVVAANLRVWCFLEPPPANDSRKSRVIHSHGAPRLVLESCDHFHSIAKPVAARASISWISLAAQVASFAPADLEVSTVAVATLTADGAQASAATDVEVEPTTEFYEAEDGTLSLHRWTPYSAFQISASYTIDLTSEAAERFDLSTAVMISVSIGFLVATSVAAALALRLVLAPLAMLREDMERAAVLSLDGIPERRSIIGEQDAMLTTFTHMVARLRSYKPMIAELRDASTLLRARALSWQSSAGSELTTGRHHVHVQLTYVSKREQRVKRLMTFDHTYRDGDRQLLHKFLDDCRLNVGAHRFEPVQLTVEESGQQVIISSNRHLEEIFTHSPDTLYVRMRKNGKPKMLSPFTLGVDLVSTVLNIGILFWIGFGGFEPVDRLGAGVFAGFYMFVIVVNCALCLWLLRQGSRFPRFQDWVSQAGLEVSILLLVGSQNTQHIHFLWSNWSIAGALHFNAPRVIAVWSSSVSVSYFGFVFSDLGQVAFKVWRLWLGTGGTGFLVFVALSLAVSIASIIVHMPKKVAHFVMTRRKGALDIDEHGLDINDQTGEARDHDTVEMPQRRPRWGHFRSLTARRVTVVLIRIPQIKDRRGVQRFALECSFVYSAAFKHVKSQRGTVLFFHAFEVAAVFNHPNDAEHHFAAAIDCAHDTLAEVNREYGLKLTAVITSEALPVGSLGTATRKSQQCFANWTQLRRIASVCEALGVRVACTARSRNSVTAAFKGTMKPIPDFEALLEVTRTVPTDDPSGAMEGVESSAAVFAAPTAAKRRLLLSDEERTAKLRALCAQFGFGVQYGLDAEATADALTHFLQRFLDRAEREQSPGNNGVTDSESDSSDEGDDVPGADQTVVYRAPSAASTAMRSSRFIAGIDVDDL